MVDLLLAIQVVTWVVVCFLFFLVGRTGSIFHPFTFYAVFHLIVFVIRPLLLQYAGFGFTYDYMRFTPTPETVSLTLVVTNMAFCLFALVSWWSGHRVPRFDRQPGPLTPLQRQALIVTFAVLTPLALYSAVINSAPRVFEGSGGIEMVIDPDTGIQTLANTTGYLLDAQGMLATLSIILLCVTRFRWYAFLPLALFLAYRAFLGWGRYAMVMSLASVLLVYLFHKGRRWPQPRFLLVAIPLFIVFQQLGEQRDYVRYLVTGERPYTWELPVERSWVERQDTLDFANFEFLTAILWAVPEHSDTYTYFTQYLQLFTQPIPRILWPEKPVGPPIMLVNMNDYVNFMGLTNSLVGDGWLSFGWIGVVITIALVAFILGRLHRAFWRNTASPRALLAYCTFVPLSLQWFRDGGITIVMFAAWALFPLVVWYASERALVFMYGRSVRRAPAPALAAPGAGLAPPVRQVMQALERTFPPAEAAPAPAVAPPPAPAVPRP
ncbi:MAG: oligosaccharide repeat unit polymerase, partial [Rhodospirillaceae bacterium]|nr:oligosaccharide repeat unit polymerase [Rhodospirillaceae bacterium]